MTSIAPLAPVAIQTEQKHHFGSARRTADRTLACGSAVSTNFQLSLKFTLFQATIGYEPDGPVRGYSKTNCPLLNTTAIVSTECQYELRYAQELTEEAIGHIDGSLYLAEQPFVPSPIFMAAASASNFDQLLFVLEPGTMHTDKPIALMTEIQL